MRTLALRPPEISDIGRVDRDRLAGQRVDDGGPGQAPVSRA